MVATDPLADKEAFSGKVLAILVAANGALTGKSIVATLQSEGLAKEPKAISLAVSQSLQQLKRRRLAASRGHLWQASVNNPAKGGRM